MKSETVLLFLALVAIDGLSALSPVHSPVLSQDHKVHIRDLEPDYSNEDRTKTEPRQQQSREYGQEDNQERIASQSQDDASQVESERHRSEDFARNTAHHITQHLSSGQNGPHHRQTSRRNEEEAKNVEEYNQKLSASYETSRHHGPTRRRISQSDFNEENEEFQQASPQAAYPNQEQGIRENDNEGLQNIGNEDGSDQHNIKRILTPTSPIGLQRGPIRRITNIYIPNQGTSETLVNQNGLYGNENRIYESQFRNIHGPSEYGENFGSHSRRHINGVWYNDQNSDNLVSGTGQNIKYFTSGIQRPVPYFSKYTIPKDRLIKQYIGSGYQDSELNSADSEIPNHGQTTNQATGEYINKIILPDTVYQNGEGRVHNLGINTEELLRETSDRGANSGKHVNIAQGADNLEYASGNGYHRESNRVFNNGLNNAHLVRRSETQGIKTGFVNENVARESEYQGTNQGLDEARFIGASDNHANSFVNGIVTRRNGYQNTDTNENLRVLNQEQRNERENYERYVNRIHSQGIDNVKYTGSSTNEFIGKVFNEGQNQPQFIGAENQGKRIVRHGIGHENGDLSDVLNRSLRKPHFVETGILETDSGKHLKGILGTENIESGPAYRPQSYEYPNLVSAVDYTNVEAIPGQFEHRIPIPITVIGENEETKSEYISEILAQAQRLLHEPKVVPNSYEVTPAILPIPHEKRIVYITPNHRRINDGATDSYMANPSSSFDDEVTVIEGAPGYVNPSEIAPKIPNSPIYRPGFNRHHVFNIGQDTEFGTDETDRTIIIGRHPTGFSHVRPVFNGNTVPENKDIIEVFIDKTLQSERDYAVPINNNEETSRGASETIIEEISPKQGSRSTYENESNISKDRIITINKDLTSQITKGNFESNDDSTSKVVNETIIEKTLQHTGIHRPHIGRRPETSNQAKETTDRYDYTDGTSNNGKSIVTDETTVVDNPYHTNYENDKNHRNIIIDKINNHSDDINESSFTDNDETVKHGKIMVINNTREVKNIDKHINNNKHTTGRVTEKVINTNDYSDVTNSDDTTAEVIKSEDIESLADIKQNIDHHYRRPIKPERPFIIRDTKKNDKSKRNKTIRMNKKATINDESDINDDEGDDDVNQPKNSVVTENSTVTNNSKNNKTDKTVKAIETVTTTNDASDNNEATKIINNVNTEYTTGTKNNATNDELDDDKTIKIVKFVDTEDATVTNNNEKNKKDETTKTIKEVTMTDDESNDDETIKVIKSTGTENSTVKINLNNNRENTNKTIKIVTTNYGSDDDDGSKLVDTETWTVTENNKKNTKGLPTTKITRIITETNDETDDGETTEVSNLVDTENITNTKSSEKKTKDIITKISKKDTATNRRSEDDETTKVIKSVDTKNTTVANNNEKNKTTMITEKVTVANYESEDTNDDESQNIKTVDTKTTTMNKTNKAKTNKANIKNTANNDRSDDDKTTEGRKSNDTENTTETTNNENNRKNKTTRTIEKVTTNHEGSDRTVDDDNETVDTKSITITKNSNNNKRDKNTKPTKKVTVTKDKPDDDETIQDRKSVDTDSTTVTKNSGKSSKNKASKAITKVTTTKGFSGETVDDDDEITKIRKSVDIENSENKRKNKIDKNGTNNGEMSDSLTKSRDTKNTTETKNSEKNRRKNINKIVRKVTTTNNESDETGDDKTDDTTKTSKLMNEVTTNKANTKNTENNETRKTVKVIKKYSGQVTSNVTSNDDNTTTNPIKSTGIKKKDLEEIAETVNDRNTKHVKTTVNKNTEKDKKYNGNGDKTDDDNNESIVTEKNMEIRKDLKKVDGSVVNDKKDKTTKITRETRNNTQVTGNGANKITKHGTTTVESTLEVVNSEKYRENKHTTRKHVETIKTTTESNGRSNVTGDGDDDEGTDKTRKSVVSKNTDKDKKDTKDKNDKTINKVKGKDESDVTTNDDVTTTTRKSVIENTTVINKDTKNKGKINKTIVKGTEKDDESDIIGDDKNRMTKYEKTTVIRKTNKNESVKETIHESSSNIKKVYRKDIDDNSDKIGQDDEPKETIKGATTKTTQTEESSNKNKSAVINIISQSKYDNTYESNEEESYETEEENENFDDDVDDEYDDEVDEIEDNDEDDYDESNRQNYETKSTKIDKELQQEGQKNKFKTINRKPLNKYVKRISERAYNDNERDKFDNDDGSSDEEYNVEHNNSSKNVKGIKRNGSKDEKSTRNTKTKGQKISRKTVSDGKSKDEVLKEIINKKSGQDKNNVGKKEGFKDEEDFNYKYEDDNDSTEENDDDISGKSNGKKDKINTKADSVNGRKGRKTKDRKSKATIKNNERNYGKKYVPKNEDSASTEEYDYEVDDDDAFSKFTKINSKDKKTTKLDKVLDQKAQKNEPGTKSKKDGNKKGASNNTSEDKAIGNHESKRNRSETKSTKIDKAKSQESAKKGQNATDSQQDEKLKDTIEKTDKNKRKDSKDENKNSNESNINNVDKVTSNTKTDDKSTRHDATKEKSKTKTDQSKNGERKKDKSETYDSSDNDKHRDDFEEDSFTNEEEITSYDSLDNNKHTKQRKESKRTKEAQESKSDKSSDNNTPVTDGKKNKKSKKDSSRTEVQTKRASFSRDDVESDESKDRKNNNKKYRRNSEADISDGLNKTSGKKENNDDRKDKIENNDESTTKQYDGNDDDDENYDDVDDNTYSETDKDDTFGSNTSRKHKNDERLDDKTDRSGNSKVTTQRTVTESSAIDKKSTTRHNYIDRINNIKRKSKTLSHPGVDENNGDDENEKPTHLGKPATNNESKSVKKHKHLPKIEEVFTKKNNDDISDNSDEYEIIKLKKEFIGNIDINSSRDKTSAKKRFDSDYEETIEETSENNKSNKTDLEKLNSGDENSNKGTTDASKTKKCKKRKKRQDKEESGADETENEENEKSSQDMDGEENENKNRRRKCTRKLHSSNSSSTTNDIDTDKANLSKKRKEESSKSASRGRSEPEENFTKEGERGTDNKT